MNKVYRMGKYLVFPEEVLEWLPIVEKMCKCHFYFENEEKAMHKTDNCFNN